MPDSTLNSAPSLFDPFHLCWTGWKSCSTFFLMRISKALFFMLLLSATLSAHASDRLLNSLRQRGLVSDFSNVIPAAEENRLTSLLNEVRQKTGAEIAVVTLPSLEGGEIDDFANRLFERWGIGQKGKDNGLLFLAAMKDRKMRIEVGYGLEGAIPDAKAGRIRRDVITPYFKAGNPGKGIVLGMAALSQEVAKEYGVTLSGSARYSSQPPSRNRKGNPVLMILFLIFFIPFAIRHPFLAMMLLSGGRGGGYRSGGGFGGGGGGFGGGMSGGGGSSGGW